MTSKITSYVKVWMDCCKGVDFNLQIPNRNFSNEKEINQHFDNLQRSREEKYLLSDLKTYGNKTNDAF